MLVEVIMLIQSVVIVVGREIDLRQVEGLMDRLT